MCVSHSLQRKFKSETVGPKVKMVPSEEALVWKQGSKSDTAQFEIRMLRANGI